MDQRDYFFLFFSFSSQTCQKSRGMRAREVSCGSRCELVGACVSQRAGVAPIFSCVYTLPMYMRM